jgi:N-formylmaleamate deformylase
MAKLIYGNVVSGGVKIHYYRTGEAKPPVILLHGLSDNGLCWSKLALALEPFYDLIMVDQRGHGLSDAPESGYGLENQSRDIVEIIRSLMLKKPVIIGHSMGAINAFATGAYFPDLVGCLILEDPPLWASQEQESLNEAQARAEKFKQAILANKTKTLDQLIEMCRSMHPTWDDVESFQWAKAKQQVSPNTVLGMTEKRESWRILATRITCPVLLITADTASGALVSEATAEEATAYWKQSKVVNIPGAGHNIRREQFSPYMAAVKDFLKEYAPY